MSKKSPIRFGGCMVPFEAAFDHAYLQPKPTAASWRALRSIGITDLRLQFNVGGDETSIEAPVSSHQGAWDTTRFRVFVEPAFAAGMKINANYCVGAPVPTHQDAAFHEASAFRFAQEFGPMIGSYSFGNEPGAEATAYERDDVSTVLRDYMRDVYFPTLCLPFVRGIRRAIPDAWILGCDADSADIQKRYTDIATETDEHFDPEREPTSFACDEEAIHPYGEVQPMDYATMAAFQAVRSHRPMGVTEIDNRDPKKLFDFTERVCRGEYPGLTRFYFLFEGSEDYFFEREPGGRYSSFYSPAPVVNDSGRAYAKLFELANGPIDPPKKALPIWRRATRS